MSRHRDVRIRLQVASARRARVAAAGASGAQVYLDGEVRRVFAGIDIDVGELLLARSLGVGADLPIGD